MPNPGRKTKQITPLPVMQSQANVTQLGPTMNIHEQYQVIVNEPYAKNKRAAAIPPPGWNS
jgi:hypothetical protein